MGEKYVFLFVYKLKVHVCVCVVDLLLGFEIGSLDCVSHWRYCR